MSRWGIRAISVCVIGCGFTVAASALGATQAETYGTVSQGGAAIALGGEGTCGPAGPPPGVECAGVLYMYGYNDQQLAVVTPGAIHVHIPIAVTFVAASSKRIPVPVETRSGRREVPASERDPRVVKGTIKAEGPSDATITFPQALRTGETVGVTVQAGSKTETLFFRPVQALSASRLRCGRHAATVTARTAVKGTLSLRVDGKTLRRSTPASAATSSIKVPVKNGKCGVAVMTLSNAMGSETERVGHAR
jgi:hypothetical protein